MMLKRNHTFQKHCTLKIIKCNKSIKHCYKLFTKWKWSRSVSDSATPWTVAYQSPQCMEFSRQAYWSELPFPSPGDLPHPGIKPESPILAGGFFHHWAPLGKPKNIYFRITLPKGWWNWDSSNQPLRICGWWLSPVVGGGEWGDVN